MLVGTPLPRLVIQVAPPLKRKAVGPQVPPLKRKAVRPPVPPLKRKAVWPQVPPLRRKAAVWPQVPPLKQKAALPSVDPRKKQHSHSGQAHVAATPRVATPVRVTCLAHPCTPPRKEVHVTEVTPEKVVMKGGVAPPSSERKRALLARWKKRLRIAPDEKRWLDSKYDDQGWQLGCKVCAASPNPSDAYARFAVAGATATISNLRRHEKSKVHRAAVQAHLVKAETLDVAGAPPAEDFVAVWRALGGGGRSRPTVMSPRKRNTIEWCLWQALRDTECSFLAAANTVSVAMDERHGRTLVTYAACKGREVSSGILAQFRDAGRSADEVAACVHKAVRRLCFARAPSASMNRKRRRPTFRKKTMQHVLRNIEMFSADGAFSEQLAGRLLHPRVERAGDVEKLPRLKMIIRDKAHAARRLTQRTFRVDSELRAVLDILICSSPSIAQMLHNSGPCSEIFRREATKQQQPGEAPGTALLDLSYAKHRFDGVARPLGTCVWNLDAVISTCSIIVRDNTFEAKFRKLCRRFLDELNPQRILLMGMMADASDEALVLCRFFDREAFEAELMAEQVVAFKSRLRALFHDEVCWSTGFTRLALKHLETQKVVIESTGTFKTIGGPGVDQAKVRRCCLQRMVAWCRLVEEVADTEFPDFELLGSFSVFRLHATNARSSTQRGCLPPVAMEESTWASNCLGHLAGAFGVDKGQLLAEFLDHRALAQSEKDKNPELSAVAVWQRTLEKTQANWQSRQTWSAKALLPVLQRFFVCPGSTAGIEQSFSQFKRITGEQYHATELVEERHFVLKLKAARVEEPPPGILGAARRIWVECFGVSRPTRGASLGVRTTLRLQKRKALSQNASSCTAWLARRRRELGAAATARRPCQSGGQRLLPMRRGNVAWTKEHEKEARRQRAVRLARVCAAAEEGTAKELKVSAQAVQDFRSTERKRAAEMAAQRRRQVAARAEPKLMAVEGKHVFVDGSALQELDTPPGAWAQLCQRLHLQQVAERNSASIFVVANPAEPGDRNGVVASMLGAMLCTPSCLACGGKGTALQLHRALRVPRYIFVSAACQGKHRTMVDLMQSVSRGAKKSRWHFYDASARQKASFLARAGRQGAHASEFITLALPTERRAFARFPRVQTLQDFARQIHKVDMGRSQMGYCKR